MARFLRALAPVVLALLLLVLWYGLTWLPGMGPYVLPTPHRVLAALIEEREILWRATAQTASLALWSFALALLVGGGLSIAMGLSGLLRRMLYPWVLVLQVTPVVVLIPLLQIWTDYDATVVVVTITFLISFFPIVANFTQGMLSVEEGRRDLFRLYGASRWQTLWLLQLPHALPELFIGLRIAATLAVVGAFTAELLAGAASGHAGLGTQMMFFTQRARVPEAMSTALLACGLGILFVGGVVAIQWLSLRRWHASATRRD